MTQRVSWLFEMIVGYLVREIEGNTIDIGEIVYDPESGRPAEIDVRRIKERQECWFYECRARQPDALIGVGEISTWFERVNRIWRFHRAERRFQGCRFGFEIWTTGLFDKEALALLNDEKAKRKDIEINWRAVRKCGIMQNRLHARPFSTRLMNITSSIS